MTRNLQEFNRFIRKHWDVAGNFLIGEDDKIGRDLLLSQILSTTTSTFGIAEDSSQFRET